jgi:hypothetical protein
MTACAHQLPEVVTAPGVLRLAAQGSLHGLKHSRLAAAVAPTDHIDVGPAAHIAAKGTIKRGSPGLGQACTVKQYMPVRPLITFKCALQSHIILPV